MAETSLRCPGVSVTSRGAQLSRLPSARLLGRGAALGRDVKQTLTGVQHSRPWAVGLLGGPFRRWSARRKYRPTQIICPRSADVWRTAVPTIVYCTALASRSRAASPWRCRCRGCSSRSRAIAAMQASKCCASTAVGHDHGAGNAKKLAPKGAADKQPGSSTLAASRPHRSVLGGQANRYRVQVDRFIRGEDQWHSRRGPSWWARCRSTSARQTPITSSARRSGSTSRWRVSEPLVITGPDSDLSW